MGQPALPSIPRRHCSGLGWQLTSSLVLCPAAPQPSMWHRRLSQAHRGLADRSASCPCRAGLSRSK